METSLYQILPKMVQPEASSSSKEAVSAKDLKIRWLLNDKLNETSVELTNFSPKQEKSEQLEPPKTILTNENKAAITKTPTTLSQFAKRPPITINFSDVCYSVQDASSSKLSGKKEIVKGVSGSFKTGELTAIIGASGAGKSSLINAIAGYVTYGVTGTIQTNGSPRQIKLFHKLSAYIMQDDLLQPQLSVEESMMIAANLKVGKGLSKEQKKQVVDEILNTLGLTQCRSTRSENLSGGQRKRLSVALELVNNPPVIFLDEPTTGLDIVSMVQLINLLQNLAKQGRTIICSIHQPPATVFEQFDHVYVMARGSCVYQGSPDQLVPFLAKAGYECPITYNPADYVIELLYDDSNHSVSTLTNQIQNGKMCCRSPKTETTTVIPHSCRDENELDLNFDFPTNFFEQFWILLKRMFTQQIRNTTSIWIMVLYHLLVGGLLGIIFIGVGNDASVSFYNVKFATTVILTFMYTHLMTPVLLFPTEVQLLKREYFNRWYGLKSYYAALTISTIPRHVIFGTVMCIMSYLITDQPKEISRFVMFELAGLLSGYISEGIGLAVGSTCTVTIGSLVGPVSVLPMIVFGLYGMDFGTPMTPFMSHLVSLSYIRSGIVAITLALLGNDRPAMYCDYQKETFCYFAKPALLLKAIKMDEVSMNNQIICLIVFVLLIRLVAFLVLRFRLTVEFTNPFLKYVSKVFRKGYNFANSFSNKLPK